MLFSDHRSHSRPLNLHLWSDHPEINIIVDKVWHSLGQYRQAKLIPKGNRKGTPPKRLLKVLLVNLYATFLDDPALWMGVARSANAYAPTSRYNSLNVSFKIVQLIDGLVELGYLEFVGGSHDKINEGFDIVQGCRLPGGGGKIEKNAMPISHRLIGNPMFTFLTKLMYQTTFNDVYCGMKILRNEFYKDKFFFSYGMVWCLEILIKSKINSAKCAELPITLHKDGRKVGKSHLKTISDGLKTLKFGIALVTAISSVD